MLLIKPASADCNLRCDYCFYVDRGDLYPAGTRPRMSGTVLQKLISSYLATDQPQYIFCWQGGEPLLMGLEFFERVVALQQQHGRPGAVIANSVQTNATLVSDAIARLFARYRFLVGCSLDGPADLHDRYRRTRGGGPSHADVLRGLDLLRRHGVAVNVLVLVSQANVRRAADVYRYLVDLGLHHHQYIPCVEFDARGRLRPYAISGPEWGDFLCELCDVWRQEDIHRVSIRDFDVALHKLVTGQDQVCTIGNDCCRYFVVEHNGDIHPCDFFVGPKHRIGNVTDMTWEEARSDPRYLAFGAQKRRRHRDCDDCSCLDLCGGDCLKFRIFGDHDASNLSWLCEGWRRFHVHAEDKFRELADRFGRQPFGP